MLFFLDNDVPDRIGFVLASEGHDVVFLRHVLPCESSDEDALNVANVQRRVLLTCNRDDFLRLVQERDHVGVIVVVRRRNRVLECAAVLRLIEKAGEIGITGNINFA